MYVYSDYIRLIILIAVGLFIFIIYRLIQDRNNEKKRRQEQEREEEHDR